MIAEKLMGLWPFLKISDFRVVADYWAIEIHRSKPYPETNVVYGYVYEDGSILTLESHVSETSNWVDIETIRSIPDGWILVEDRRKVA